MTIHESSENYLKTIFILQARQGEVRPTDVAREMGFSKPSVTRAVKKLSDEELVEKNACGRLVLTKKGGNTPPGF